MLGNDPVCACDKRANALERNDIDWTSLPPFARTKSEQAAASLGDSVPVRGCRDKESQTR